MPNEEPMKMTKISEVWKDVTKGTPGRRAARTPEEIQIEKNLYLFIFDKNVAPIKPAIIIEIGYVKPKVVYSKLASPKTFANLLTTV